MAIEKIFWPESHEKLLVLREVGGSRRLAFPTGYFEASPLWWFIKGEPIRRPPTHEPWVSTVLALGWKASSACVVDRREQNYFAEIRLVRERVEVKVDVRPSDAIIFALRANVPLLFKEKVLVAYGVSEPEPA